MVSKLARKRSNRYKLRSKNKSKRLRLSVHRSSKHIYVQLIDDSKGLTIVSSSSVDKNIASKIAGLSKTEIATIVGKDVGQKLVDSKISDVYFDRGSYLYHGRVQTLADAVRSLGINF